MLIVPHLHRDLAVVDEDLAGQEVGADGGLVAGAKLFVDLASIVLAKNLRPEGVSQASLFNTVAS